MDFELTDEQALLREAVQRWVDRSYPFDRYRSIAQSGGFSTAAWQELAELGLTGLNVAQCHGGLEMSPVEAMLVLEQMGAGLVLEPLSQCFISSALLNQYADAELQSRWLPQIAAGSALVVLATQERGARYQLDFCQSFSTRTLDKYTITATKSIVPAGDFANAFIVSAQLEGQLALFLIEQSALGVQSWSYNTQDGSCAAEIRFDHASATLITRQGAAALALARDIGIACTCAQGVGVMDKILHMTADYLNTRHQFGVAIGSFQALRHRIADMKMQLELARSMSYYASLKLHAPVSERCAALSRAKVQLGQSMRFVGQQAIQLHGGMGVTDEHAVSHYFKKLTQLEISFGDTLHHLGEVCAGMQDTAGVFD